MVLTPTSKSTSSTSRKSYAKLPTVLDVPNLIKVQLDSFQRFQEEGLRQLLEEISPIRDLTGNRLELSFVAYEFREPRSGHSEQECHERDLTYSAPLYVKVRLLVKETGEIKEQDLFFGDIPLMTAKGTFITSGAERVVVSQLLRSPGVYFTSEEDPVTGRELSQAKLIPTRGAWLDAGEVDKLNQAVAQMKKLVPQKGTSLLNAVDAIGDMKPAPDNIFLLTDSLPTMGAKKPWGKRVSGQKRLKLFNEAVRRLPSGVPVNIIFYPMEGDPFAASAFWQLAKETRGSFFCPSRDWP